MDKADDERGNPGFDPEEASDVSSEDKNIGIDMEFAQQGVNDSNFERVMDDIRSFAETNRDDQVTNLASTASETQERLMEEAYEDVTSFMSQLDSTERDELTTMLI